MERSCALACYISGHGFGHASRVIEAVDALLQRDPALHVVVRTTAPQWLFDRRIRDLTRLRYESLEVDTGVVQIDSLHLDEHATVARAREFMTTFDARVAAEVEKLRRDRTQLVVADLPPLGIAAGVDAGLPTMGFGNFTWDWIYSAYPATGDLVSTIGEIYARADGALRLPMWGGFDRFQRVVDLPFVARHSQRDPDDTRRALGLPLNERLVLMSFGGYGLEGIDLDALSTLNGFVAIVSGSVPLGTLPDGLQTRRGSLIPFDERRMYAAGFRYEDLVRAVDVVVTKPGYGIIAECLANHTALLYTSRGNFIEYDVLVAALPRFLRAEFIDHDDLFAGRWQSHLDRLLGQAPPPERPATNGADVAAELLLSKL